VFDGNTPGIDVQAFEQLLYGHGLLEIVRVPVERNPHGLGLAEFYCTESGGWGKAGIWKVRNVRFVLIAERRTIRTVPTI